MSFRRKLLLVFALTVFLSVAGVALLVQWVTRNAFEKTENQRTAALVAQFQREFSRRGDDVARRVEAIAASDSVTRMATALNGTSSDFAEYFDLARLMAENHQLDFVEILDGRGTIVSSAQWPAKFGYPEAAFESLSASNDSRPFLKLEELQDSTALGFFAARAIHVGERSVYVVGGRKLDKNFLSALDLPADTRALLYQNRGDHFSPDLLLDPGASAGVADPARPADKFAPLIDAVRKYDQEISGVVDWTSDRADEEMFHAIPLRGVGKDHPLLGILLSSWASARVTRPVVQLARAAQDVASGNLEASVQVEGHDEVAQLAESFNRMTSELLAQKERLVQTERVAAWRELARRLAHELKNPLFPLQLTVENLIRAREQSPEMFEEIFREGSQTLLAEISNLKGIIGRFSEFSKMPQPQLQSVQVNEVIEAVARLFHAQCQAKGHEAIHCEMQLDRYLGPIAADPELLHRALSNLVLNAMDAMPNGGTLTLRTRPDDGKVVIEVCDTGSGLTREECERIFTPYYTSKQHGTGLGLAIVQSVVSDHGGRISVQSEPGKGTTFVIELPKNVDAVPATARPKEEAAGKLRV